MPWVSGYTSPLVHSPCSHPLDLSSISSFLDIIYGFALCLLHFVHRSYQVNQGYIVCIVSGLWKLLGSWSFFWTKTTIVIRKYGMVLCIMRQVIYTFKLPNHKQKEGYNTYLETPEAWWFKVTRSLEGPFFGCGNWTFKVKKNCHSPAKSKSSRRSHQIWKVLVLALSDWWIGFDTVW